MASVIYSINTAKQFHCVKRVQIQRFFWSVVSCIQSEYRKYGPEKTPYLATFQAVCVLLRKTVSPKLFRILILLLLKFIFSHFTLDILLLWDWLASSSLKDFEEPLCGVLL